MHLASQGPHLVTQGCIFATQRSTFCCEGMQLVVQCYALALAKATEATRLNCGKKHFHSSVAQKGSADDGKRFSALEVVMCVASRSEIPLRGGSVRERWAPNRTGSETGG